MSTAAGVRALVRDCVGSTRGHDLALYAAVVVLVGYVVTLRLGARDGHPLAAPGPRNAVSQAA